MTAVRCPLDRDPMGGVLTGDPQGGRSPAGRIPPSRMRQMPAMPKSPTNTGRKGFSRILARASGSTRKLTRMRRSMVALIG